MSFPRYERYKDSGVEWLGEVPEHWDRTKLRRISIRYSGGTPDKTKLEYWDAGTIPWLGSGEVNQLLISRPSTFITEEAFKNSSAKWIPSGALVMALAGQGKTKGMVAQLAIPSTCNQSMAAIVPREMSQARFLFWWLSANYQNIRNMAGGDLRDGLNLELLGDIDCPLVPKSERMAIARFLDKETGKIDFLIDEQRRLIELLKEKRQAIISHAVTKGLNPDVAYVPSIIEGIGGIPCHWKVLRVKHVSRFTTSGPRGWSERISESGSIFVQSGDLNDALQIDFDGCKRVQVEAGAEASRTLLANSDTVVCITGAKTGNVAVCDNLQEPAYVNQHLCLIRTNERVSPRFLGLLLKSRVGQTHFEVSQYGLKQGLSLEDIREAPVLLPPLSEQAEIVCFLDLDAAKFGALYKDAEVAVNLLRERRAALISAAVTGKIDVRKYTPKETA